MHLFELFLSRQRRHRMLKNFVVASFSTSGRPHYHKTMSDLNGIVQLNYLHDEIVYRLQVIESTRVVDSRQQVSIVLVRFLNPWEQIQYDVFEERQVIFEELRHIDISQSPQKQLVFIHVLVCSLQDTSCVDNRPHSTHPIVIVVLGAQLLGTQLEGGHHLASKVPPLQEPKGVKHDLAYHGVIWHHHSDRSEESLQVVWELCPPSIPRVHRDEHTKSRLHFDERLLKVDLRLIPAFGPKQDEQLLSNHREHLHIDSVELIKTGPSSSAGEALEELCHHDVVHPIGAVENNTLLCQGFGEIFS
mmetsp:Transcript_9667/g.9377  ORF Transcript_9667/g.9377 Transcript_9667/m.9377 type:complete len:303 (-) Transcript_9667:928-1836(-)